MQISWRYLIMMLIASLLKTHVFAESTTNDMFIARLLEKAKEYPVGFCWPTEAPGPADAFRRGKTKIANALYQAHSKYCG